MKISILYKKMIHQFKLFKLSVINMFKLLWIIMSKMFKQLMNKSTNKHKLKIKL